MNSKSRNFVDENELNSNDENYSIINSIIISFKIGVIGFLAIFSLLFLTKFLAHSINYSKALSLESGDVVISFWGFIIFSFIIFCSRYKF